MRRSPTTTKALMQRLAADVEVAIRVAPQQWHIPARLEQLSIKAPAQTAAR